MEQKTSPELSCLGPGRPRQPRGGMTPHTAHPGGACAQREAWPRRSSVHGCARACNGRAPPATRRAVVQRWGDAGASSPGPRGAAGGARPPAPPQPPAAPVDLAPCLRLPVPPLPRPASPVAAPAGFYGNSAGKHGFQRAQRRPRQPKPRQRAAPPRGSPGGPSHLALPPSPLPTRVTGRSAPGRCWWPRAAGWGPRPPEGTGTALTVWLLADAQEF